ncbi:MAG: hypothetical protein ACYDG2_02175 [Ruminiclostridium sp.]
MGVSGDGVSASSSSSWQTITTPKKYWNNTNGVKTADYPTTNITIGPSVDYRADTICTYNTAYVKLSSDLKTYSITASV